MKIAYLILAHQNISQLALLIDLLTYENHNYCFLHLDARVYSPSAIKQLKKETKSKNWHSITGRSYINWGGFSMVEATLNLLIDALNFKTKEFDYVSLHSGMDLPIKNNQQIEKYLITNHGKQFIDYFELPNYKNWGGNGGLDRVNYYWLIDELGVIEAQKIVDAQKAIKMEKPQSGFSAKIYGGSQWWTITSDCAKYIINFLNDTPRFYHFFKYAYIADELFFQTIILNSPHKHQVENNNLRVIDWKSGPNYPKIFNINDIENLEFTTSLFARKFDVRYDEQIIVYLKNKIHASSYPN
ncbi:hypothetical protein CPT03_02225 [Pedobacter ginsengisoli]|uniref:Peptide O-xylosyltransferase n=1 Tax=Pedobacter ginsengisoli TaxID=363852 RepID=A0A2D1U162_9SPHI|nr:beta-1,6-N-acetylglucosaminyltransferase [Pedobacter ginsengisoli]ATP55362.1 hypothetical protein CPT03_02225 [Pedobacter ginsengisoli]